MGQTTSKAKEKFQFPKHLKKKQWTKIWSWKHTSHFNITFVTVRVKQTRILLNLSAVKREGCRTDSRGFSRLSKLSIGESGCLCLRVAPAINWQLVWVVTMPFPWDSWDRPLRVGHKPDGWMDFSKHLMEQLKNSALKWLNIFSHRRHWLDFPLILKFWISPRQPLTQPLWQHQKKTPTTTTKNINWSFFLLLFHQQTAGIVFDQRSVSPSSRLRGSLFISQRNWFSSTALYWSSCAERHAYLRES